MLRRVALMFGGLLAVIALAAAAVFIYLTQLDVAGRIAAQAEEATGRPAAVGAGDLQLFWPPVISASDIRVANAPWGSEELMVAIDEISAEIDVSELLSGRLRYDRVRVDGARILLERGPDGETNWDFNDEDELPFPPERETFPELHDFRATNSRLVYRDAAEDTEIDIGFETLEIAAEGTGRPVNVRAEGSYNGMPMRVQGTGGSLAELRDVATPYPARFALTSPAADVRFDGTINIPFRFDEVEGQVVLEGNDLAPVAEFLGLDLPPTAPFHIAGTLDRRGERWLIAEAEGFVGDDGFSGEVQMTVRRPRGLVNEFHAELAVERIDLDQLISALADDDGVADDPFPVPRDLVVTVDFAAGEVDYGSLTFEDVRANVLLEEDRIAVDPLHLALAGGVIQGAGEALRTNGAPQVVIDLTVTDADAVAAALETLPDDGLDGPLEFQRVQGRVAIDGQDLAPVASFFGVELASTPPFRIEGLLDRENARWSFIEAVGNIGDKTFRGRLSKEPAEAPDQLDEYHGMLVMNWIDLDRVIAALGDEAEDLDEVEAEEVEILPEDAFRAIPPLPLDFPSAHGVAVAMEFVADEVTYAGLTFDNVSTSFRLAPDHLTIHELRLDLAGGDLLLEGEGMRVDGATAGNIYLLLAEIDVDLVAQVLNLDAGEITGNLALRLELNGTGETLQGFAGTMTGEATVFMDEGSIQRTLVQMLAVDILALLLTDPPPADHTDIVCLIGHFEVRDGLAEIAALLLETGEAILLGDGTIDFRTEIVDVVVDSEAETGALFALEAPLQIGGTFTDPDFGPNPVGLIARAGLAGLLGAFVAPVAALVPLIDIGLGEGSRCADYGVEATG